MVAIKNAHAANPTYVPGLTPTTDDVDDLLVAAQKLLDKKADLEEQLKANTKQIADANDKLVDIFVSKWATQTQAAIGMNQDKAVLLGYQIKGQKQVEPPTESTVPLISDIDISVHGKHTLSILNALTGKKALPAGILRTDIYGQTGGTTPADLTQLIANGGGYLGEAVRGKFVNTFSNDKAGETEFYIAVYILKSTKKPFTQSKVVSALIT
ncbi:MAG: hypothetical protein WCL06_08415 [Bacteroidota bacterium]